MSWVAVMGKALREVVRQPVAAATVLGLPLVMMLVFGNALPMNAEPATPIKTPAGATTAPATNGNGLLGANLPAVTGLPSVPLPTAAPHTTAPHPTVTKVPTPTSNPWQDWVNSHQGSGRRVP